MAVIHCRVLTGACW